MRIINTDNFGSDYPSEQFVLWSMGPEAAKEVAEVLNKWFSGDQAPRYFKVVPDDYELAPGFEP